jgi:hypothetical protein
MPEPVNAGANEDHRDGGDAVADNLRPMRFDVFNDLADLLDELVGLQLMPGNAIHEKKLQGTKGKFNTGGPSRRTPSPRPSGLACRRVGVMKVLE